MNKCFHCGESCGNNFKVEEKYFCCLGCQTVFEILSENNLSYYYDLEHTPGISPNALNGKFDFLKNESIVNTLLDFNAQGIQIVTFTVPTMHCSSCIWVLEHLSKIHKGVLSSQVNFPAKTVRIQYYAEKLSLYKLALLLSRLGYEPVISLESGEVKRKPKSKALIYKLGIAGFAFGNVMFLSFPEYFQVSEFWLERFKHLFRLLMFLFSVPVVFYAAQDYFISAYKGLRSRIFNIDVPIALGISVLFLRSTADVFLDLGSGFFDSLTGLVFFLLLGKFFQQKTYAYLSFERDYKSYFPIAVTQILKNKKGNNQHTELQTRVKELQVGDRILIRNGEIIPVDAFLRGAKAYIDYSFVTGESDVVKKSEGELILAGGKHTGPLIEMEVAKTVEDSYLIQLWAQDALSKTKQTPFRTLTDKISKKFTISILTVAFVGLLFWGFYNPALALNVFTAVLIVACPCAIALAAPFTLGNILRYFGKHNLYIKDANVIEKLARIDTIVFDKTGTITTSHKPAIFYFGVPLTKAEESLLNNTLRSSNHPLSRMLYKWLKNQNIYTLDDFKEEVGAGIYGKKGSQKVYAGSYSYVQQTQTVNVEKPTQSFTGVHVATNTDYKGYYKFKSNYRKGLKTILQKLVKQYEIIILSGDNNSEDAALRAYLPENTPAFYNKTPDEKLSFIKALQAKGAKVLMIGDGLNDAGALAQSNVGLAVSENLNVFSPACDGILDAKRFSKLPEFIILAKKAMTIIRAAFIFSLLYNIVGLLFALSGNLEPIVAAVLMPLSSISIVVFTTLSTAWISRKLKP